MSATQASPGSAAELVRLLRNQLEWYFSPENLANDRYLNSQVRTAVVCVVAVGAERGCGLSVTCIHRHVGM